MEIEILTTKKKLSASLIKQIPIICPKNWETISVLGGLRNVFCPKSYLLLCFDNEAKRYFLLNTKYYILEPFEGQTIYSVRFDTNPVIAFETREEMCIWFAIYQDIVKETKQLFI